jgi:hypothetical protein
MENASPGIRRSLRQAQLYGYLIARNERLYHPGGSHPVCSLQIGLEMVRCGWMRIRDGGRCEITLEGLRRFLALDRRAQTAFGFGRAEHARPSRIP